MKRSISAAIAVAAIVAVGAAIAQQSGGKPPPPSAEMKAVDKASPKLLTGKVTQVDAGTHSFTVQAKGVEQRFVAAKGLALPKLGEVLDITYRGNPGGPMEAVNLNSSKSNVY